jgi:hypothetical protein
MNKIIFKYAVVMLSAFLLSYCYFKYIFKQQYLANTVVYPTSTLNAQYFLEAGLRFGDEKELNELLEVFSSNDVLIKLANQIQAHETYRYAADGMSFYDQLKALKKRIQIERSLNRSAKIVVQDDNVDRAVYIANTYVREAYAHLNNIISERVNAQAMTLDAMYQAKRLEVIVLQDSLTKLEALGDVRVSGLILLKKPRYRFCEGKFEAELKKMAELKHQTEHLQGLLKRKLPPFFVVSRASSSTAVKKIDPLLYASAFALMASLLFGVIINRKTFFDFSRK